jgi:hypothetical protein
MFVKSKEESKVRETSNIIETIIMDSSKRSYTGWISSVPRVTYHKKSKALGDVVAQGEHDQASGDAHKPQHTP